MIPLTVTPDVDNNPWLDLRGKVANPDGTPIVIERIGLLRHGTKEGRATVAVVIRMPDGRALIAEQTWRNFKVAFAALAAGPAASEET